MRPQLNEIENDLKGQSEFIYNLLDPDTPSPKGLVGPDGKPDEKRFSVYRNNVISSLTEALAGHFPAIKTLLGEDFFNAMARVYIRQEPPHVPIISEYGIGFAHFIENFERVQKYPFMADVARIERAWTESYNAADAQPMPSDILGQFAPEQLGELVFTAHPAARIVKSEYAAVSIFSASREGRDLKGIKITEPEDCLVMRPDMAVNVYNLPQGAAVFFEALINGHNLGEAAGNAATINPEFDIAMAISHMVEVGLFVECKIP